MTVASLRRLPALVLALGVLASSPGTASAWSARGHQLVGDVATQYLNPAATLGVAELLRDDLGADGKPSGRATLAQVGSWPDELRATPEQRATGVYHYDDVPICGTPDRAAYCPDGKCATAWLAKQLAILKDRSQPARARNDALKWIAHLIGDLHQPLHASNHDDRGGNDVKITFFGRRADDPGPGGQTPSPYNLHTAWDRLIPARMLDERGGAERFLADQPEAGARRAWEAGTVDGWALETFVLARDVLYPMLPVAFQCSRPIAEVVALDEPYYRAAASLAAVQLRKAGVRLAKMLNDAFAER